MNLEKQLSSNKMDKTHIWEIIADKLSKAGFSWGCSSEIDSTGRVIFTADAYARDGCRFTVLSDEKLSGFLELERATGVSLGEKRSFGSACSRI